MTTATGVDLRWGGRFRGRGVRAVTSSGCVTYRPNKTAAGMTNTLRRHKRGWNAVTNTLAVRGTFDRLTGWYWNVTMKYAEARCACCGATHPNTRVPRLSLSEHGKRRLAELRRLRGMS